MELNNLRHVIKCISYLKLDSKFPLDSLMSRIKELEKEKELNMHSQLTEWEERQVNEPCLIEESVEKQSDGALYPCLSLELENKPIGEHCLMDLF